MKRLLPVFFLLGAADQCAPPSSSSGSSAKVFSADATSLATTSADAAPDIPPLKPGELSPLGITGPGLHPLYAAPMGEEVEPSQVAVVFDRPMVPLGKLEQDVPVSCSPAIEGRARWAGTSTAVIVPEGYHMKAATAYTCTVPKGTAALDGTALEKPLSWTFSTRRPALRRSWPHEGDDQWKPDDPLILRFNQDVTPATVGRSLAIVAADGTKATFSVDRPSGEHDHPDTVAVHARLARDTTYTVTVQAGLRSDEGPLPSAEDAAFTFSTFPALTVVSAPAAAEGVDPEDSLEFEFSTPVPAKEVNAHLTITPTPPDGWKPADAYSSRWWYYRPRLKPRTKYTIALSPGVKDDYGQALAEGTSITFTTGDLSPMIDTPSSSNDVYPANNPAQVPVRWRNVSAVDVKVETLDPATILASGNESSGWTDVASTASASVRLKPEDKPNFIQVGYVDLAPHLDGGHGIFRITSSAPEITDYQGAPVEFSSFFQVTDLGATIKLMPDGALVWVTRLSDATPVADADVTIAHEGKTVWTGKTDKDGIAVATGDLVPDSWNQWDGNVGVLVRSGTDATLAWTSWGDGFQGWDHGVYADFSPRQQSTRLEVYADRGVYRAGDTVHFAGLARVLDRHALTSPKLRDFSWEMEGPEGNTVATGQGKFDGGGAFAMDVVVPEDGATGDYSLRVTSGDDHGYASVPVRAYRAPTFRVDVDGPKNVVAGGTLEATVNARYLFGAPMNGQKLHWSVYRAPRSLQPDQWEGYSFGALASYDPWSETTPYESQVSSGDGKTDAKGTFPVAQALPAADITTPQSYIVEATVTDTDRQQVSNRASFPVDSADTYPGVRVKDWLGTTAQPVQVQVVAVHGDGTDAAGETVKLTVLQRAWDTVQERGMDGLYHWVSTPKDTVVETGQATTVAGAAAPWTFTPKQSGYHVIRAETKDKQGRVASAETDVYVLGGDIAWARSDGQKLDLLPDKHHYEPGETAKILVKTPKPGMTALVTVEREGVWSQRLVPLATTADAISVPITEEMMPNAYVSVVIAEGAPPATRIGAGRPGVWFGETELKVDSDRMVADVKLGTDRDAYQPRDPVKVHLTAQRGGKPLANAHVTLWAVDYGVLSLTAYQTPDLHDAFYRARPLSVLTADNRIAVYDRGAHLAKGAAIGGDGGLDPSVRSKFETTPLWMPNLRTDKNGVLDTSFALPDNLTTFRLMAVVDDGAAAFGNAEHELRVNRPLIAQPALPRFFRAGDHALAGVVLHNNTEGPLDVTVSAAVTGATLGGAPATVQVASGEAKEVPFDLSTFTATKVHFHFDATGGSNRDAVELDVPVVPLAVTETVATSGSTTTSATDQIAPPPEADRGVGGLSVDLSASVLVGMGASVDYLVDYPYGCIEQTGSRLRGALLAKRVGDRAGMTSKSETVEAIVSAGLARMESFRVPGGGMSYWPGGDRTSGPATAYALEVLSEAKAGGYKVDGAELDQLADVTRRFLAGDFVEPWWNEDLRRAAQARAALSLARTGRGDAAFNQRIWDERAKLPFYARLELMESIGRTTGADKRTAELQRELESNVHVEATSASVEDPDDGMWSSLWYGNGLGTSTAVRALLATQPTHPLIERFALHLVEGRKRGRWANTYTTADALEALATYSERFEKGNVDTEILLGGKSLLTGTLGLNGAGSVKVPMAQLMAGPLEVRSTNGGRVYYESRLAYAEVDAPPRDEGFTLTRDLAVLEGSGSGASVTPGALVRITLRVVTPVDRYNVALVDHLPAGLEPVDTFFATTASSAGAQEENEGSSDTAAGESPSWWSTWIFDRRELHDDDARFFASWMPPGIHTISYLARATTPGEYTQPGATVEEMYKPETYGRTESRHFVVGSAPVAER